jgi:sugar O-acyltransferase (sialic acid O-acetyltransferase NeuD family)
LTQTEQPVDVVIYGASGFSMALRDMIETGLAPQKWRVVAHIDDFTGDDPGKMLAGAPVIGFQAWQDRYRGHPCAIAVGACGARRMLANKIIAAGGELLTAYPRGGTVSPHVQVADGTIIGQPAYVGPFTSFGSNVLQMPMSVVGHDVVIGDYCTLCSSTSIAGYVELEDEVFLGAGAIIMNGRPGKPLRIGKGAVIAAGAVVTKSVPPGVKMMGNPARQIRQLAAIRRESR